MILDYAREYSEVPFSEQSINYLDGLMLSQLSWLDYSEQCYDVPIAEAISMAETPDNQPGEGRGHATESEKRNDAELFSIIAASKRFESVRIVASENKFIPKQKQFAAVALTVDLDSGSNATPESNKVLVFAFRGTDATLTGWKESLRLSLEQPMAAQLDASEFVQSVAMDKKFTNLPMLFAGHSKGGNLALYSACAFANRSVADGARIAAVLDFDGLGLSKTMRSTSGYELVAPLTHVFIPGGSIVGPLMNHESEHVQFIKSKAFGASQHLIYNWETEGTYFVPWHQTLDGRMITGVLQLMIRHMNDSQKDKLFNTIFMLLGDKKRL